MSIAAFFTSLVALSAACGLPAHLERQVPPKTAITNVHVFDGTKFGEPKTVVVVGGIITNANANGATVVNGNNGYLIPGLIDAHCHITSCSSLTTMRRYGVTTALDMGSFPYSVVSACKASGVTDILGSGAAGTVNGTSISYIPGFPSDSFITDPLSAQKFVADRIAEGTDYIKVFLDPLGPDDATLAAVTKTAHQAGKIVISHVTTYDAYVQAQQAGVDILTHAPLDRPLDDPSIAKLTGHVVPTLIMMQSIVNNTHAPYEAYTVAAQGSVSAIYEAGVPVVVGTDANSSPYVPANPPFGESIHDELSLLVAAGISNVDALRGATSLAAAAFRLYDRGLIKAGLRADLVLLQNDPTVDIANSRTILKVWVAGIMTDVTA